MSSSSAKGGRGKVGSDNLVCIMLFVSECDTTSEERRGGGTGSDASGLVKYIPEGIRLVLVVSLLLGGCGLSDIGVKDDRVTYSRI